MAKGKSTIISEIESYVSRCGGMYSDWYVGIASDPRSRLFNDHAVSETSGNWIFRQCQSSEDARTVETRFLGLGMRGGTGGGDDSSDHVYSYKITRTTRE